MLVRVKPEASDKCFETGKNELPEGWKVHSLEETNWEKLGREECQWLKYGGRELACVTCFRLRALCSLFLFAHL